MNIQDVYANMIKFLYSSFFITYLCYQRLGDLLFLKFELNAFVM